MSGDSRPGRVRTKPYTMPAVQVRMPRRVVKYFTTSFTMFSPRVCSFSVIPWLTRQFMRGAKWSP